MRKAEFLKQRYGDSMKKETKVAKVMREFKKRKLRSSSGAKVSDRKQAIAIALSEAARMKKGK